MLRLCLIALGVLALPACAATMPPTYPVYRPPPPVAETPPDPQVEDLFANAPSAPLLNELRHCNASGGSNTGKADESGAVLAYRPYIFTGSLALLRNPTSGACLSSGFGQRATASGGERAHTGLDLANRAGGFVYAAAEGRVVFTGWRGNYGQVIELDHGDGVRTLYAHLSAINPLLVETGWAPAGAPIARMGATGNASGIHLHYEVIVDGERVDPLNYGWELPDDLDLGS